MWWTASTRTDYLLEREEFVQRFGEPEIILREIDYHTAHHKTYAETRDEIIILTQRVPSPNRHHYLHFTPYENYYEPKRAFKVRVSDLRKLA